MNTLIIEDDPVTSRSIAMLLNQSGFYSYTAVLGQEGLDFAKVYDYALILLDLDLPDMNGLEVLRQLRTSGDITPVMVVTGSNDTHSKLKAFGFGADDYLTKPFHREELVARAHAIVSRSNAHKDKSFVGSQEE